MRFSKQPMQRQPPYSSMPAFFHTASRRKTSDSEHIDRSITEPLIILKVPADKD
jgi:hypothetical protein